MSAVYRSKCRHLLGSSYNWTTSWHFRNERERKHSTDILFLIGRRFSNDKNVPCPNFAHIFASSISTGRIAYVRYTANCWAQNWVQNTMSLTKSIAIVRSNWTTQSFVQYHILRIRLSSLLFKLTDSFDSIDSLTQVSQLTHSLFVVIHFFSIVRSRTTRLYQRVASPHERRVCDFLCVSRVRVFCVLCARNCV